MDKPNQQDSNKATDKPAQAVPATNPGNNAPILNKVERPQADQDHKDQTKQGTPDQSIKQSAPPVAGKDSPTPPLVAAKPAEQGNKQDKKA